MSQCASLVVILLGLTTSVQCFVSLVNQLNTKKKLKSDLVVKNLNKFIKCYHYSIEEILIDLLSDLFDTANYNYFFITSKNNSFKIFSK